MIFDAKPRSRTAPKSRGESDYAFYDSSARPEFQVYRDLLNTWVAELPEADRSELITRFKKNDSLGYQAALAELVIHGALKRRGYSIELHPLTGHETRRLDYCVRDTAGAIASYVEVTSFGPAQDEVAEANRDASIYNAIDKVKLPPGFRLGYDVVEYGKTTPKIGKLCSEVEAWAALSAQDDPSVIPSNVFEAGDWKIKLMLFGGFRKDVEVTRSIGGAMNDLRVVNAETEIREALEKKGTRYGILHAPYVVVIADCKDELTGGDRNAECLLDAVFGTEVTVDRAMADGSFVTSDERKRNGYWGTRDAPKHRNVSAVVLLPRSHIWDLRNDRWQPLILLNPFADHPLDKNFLPLPGFAYCPDHDHFAPSLDTVRMADILGLPLVWPPE